MLRKAAHYLTLGYVEATSTPEPVTLTDHLLHAKLEALDKFDDADPVETKPATSEIEQLKDMLNKQHEEILRQRAVWFERLQLLSKLDSVHPDHMHQADCTQAMQHNASAMQEFFKKFAEFFHTAKSAMDNQIAKEMDGHIVSLQAHMEHLMRQAQSVDSDDARRDAYMHISNAAMVMLDELSNLTTNFTDEIEECIKDEALLEQKAQVLVNAGIYYIQNLLNIIIPPVDIQFGEEYLNFLGRELEEPENRYLEGVAQAEGMLDKAARITDSYMQPYRQQNLEGAFKNVAGAMTLFSGNALAKAEQAQQDKDFEQEVRNFINM